MTAEFIAAADRFDSHSRTCPICSQPGPALCDEGLRLLKEFYESVKDWRFYADD